MFSPLRTSGLLAALMLGWPAIGSAAGVNLSHLKMQCERTAGCAYQDADNAGNVRFKFAKGDRTLNVKCSRDGGCAMMLPRGKSYEISDVTGLFTAQ
jgi:hypothetical protein